MNTTTVTAATFALGARFNGYPHRVTEVAPGHAGVIVAFGRDCIRFYRYGDPAPAVTPAA